MVDLDTGSWGARNAHDPTIVRGDDGLWYMFSTDAAAGVDSVPAGAHVRTHCLARLERDAARFVLAGCG